MKDQIRLFIEVSKLAFQRQISYRAATLAGLLTNLFFGLLRAAVMVALYGAREQVQGVSLAGAVTYTGLTQAIIGFMSLIGWFELMNTVYTGAVASDLLKPVGFYSFWLAQDLGRAVVQFLARGLPLMAVYALFVEITFPQGVVQWAALGLSMVLAWLVSFAWRFLINLSAFWEPHAVGTIRFGFIFWWFLSGFMMPLRFFPEWFQRLCYLTPFPHTVNSVTEIYLELHTGTGLIPVLLAQAAWAVALMALGQVVLRAGLRRLVVVGG